MNAVTGTAEAMNQIALTSVTGEANPNLPQMKMVITTENGLTTMGLGIVGAHEEDTTADLGIDRVTEAMTMDHLVIDRVTEDTVMVHLVIEEATEDMMMGLLVISRVTEEMTTDLLVIDQVTEDMTTDRLVIDQATEGMTMDPLVGTVDTMTVLEGKIGEMTSTGTEIAEEDLAVDGIMVTKTGMPTLRNIHVWWKLPDLKLF